MDSLRNLEGAEEKESLKTIDLPVAQYLKEFADANSIEMDL